MAWSRHLKFNVLPSMVCWLAVTAFADKLPVRVVTIDEQPPERPYTKIAADFSGDGMVDIAIGGARGPLVWYEYPAWKKRVVAEGGYRTVEGEAADIDGDGDLDIVMGGIVWYENPGPTALSRAGSWTAHRVAEVRTHDVEIGDLDGDGKLDIVTRNQSSFSNPSGNRFYIWRQDHPDEWSGREIECPHGEGIKLCDIDRDGDLDVVLGVRWYENPGDILQGPWTEHVYASAWQHADAEVQCHDLNNDGRVDIILTPAELKGDRYRISWFAAPEDARDANWKEHTIEAEQESIVHALGVADMNNDGKPDVVIAEMHQGDDPDEVRVYLNQGGGQSWQRQVLSTTGSHDIVLADIGADGDIDIVGANHAGAFQAVQLWENLTQQSTARPIAAASETETFRWPQGVLGAVTLTYDDAISSHCLEVAPALEAVNLRGTFYVTVGAGGFRNHLDAWQRVAKAGHELGNHSLFHPCRKDRPGQHTWLSDDYNLSNYSPQRWLQEMRVANMVLQLIDGKSTRTFGNTCCDNSVGPLENQTSLEELIPQLFVAGRGEFTRTTVDPRQAHLPALGHYGADGRTFEELREEIEAAITKGKWIIYMIHGVGQGTHNLFIEAEEHQKLIEYLSANRNRIWTAPAVDVVQYLTR